MRKILAASIAALVAAAGTTAALAAQAPGGSMKVTVSPSQAGTKKHPRNARLKLTIKNDDHSLTADKLTIFVAKNVRLTPAGLKFCSAKQITTDKSKCPKLSRAGSGTAHAIAGVNNPPGVPLTFNVTSFLIGKATIGFYLEQQGGAIKVLAKGTLSSVSGRFGKKITVAIPSIARQFPPGVYNGLVDLTTSLSLRSGKHFLISTNGCPANNEWPFKATIHFQPNPNPPPKSSITVIGAAACTRA